MPRDYDLVGLTNVMTDIIVNVTDDELKEWKLIKGFHNSSSKLHNKEFLDELLKRERMVVHGGSPGNVVYGGAIFGLKTALFGTIGNDLFGKKYMELMENCGVDTYFSEKEGKSGLVYVLVTSDREKTFVADLGVSGKFDVNLNLIDDIRVFHTSGYEILDNHQTTKEVIMDAKRKGAKISLDLADPSVISKFKEDVEEILSVSDIVFMTEAEAKVLKGTDSAEVLYLLDDKIEYVVLKKGDRGSVVKFKNKIYDIPVYPVNVVNTNGAGDTYAAGFLFGVLRNLPVQEIGNLASYYASRVVAREEPHL